MKNNYTLILIPKHFIDKLIAHDMRSRKPVLSHKEFEWLIDYLETLNRESDE
jgi:hypothetical protein